VYPGRLLALFQLVARFKALSGFLHLPPRFTFFSQHHPVFAVMMTSFVKRTLPYASIIFMVRVKVGTKNGFYSFPQK